MVANPGGGRCCSLMIGKFFFFFLVDRMEINGSGRKRTDMERFTMMNPNFIAHIWMRYYIISSSLLYLSYLVNYFVILWKLFFLFLLSIV